MLIFCNTTFVEDILIDLIWHRGEMMKKEGQNQSFNLFTPYFICVCVCVWVFFLHSLLGFEFLSTNNLFKRGRQMALQLKVSPGWDAHWPAQRPLQGCWCWQEKSPLKAAGRAARSAMLRRLLVWEVPVTLWRVDWYRNREEKQVSDR